MLLGNRSEDWLLLVGASELQVAKIANGVPALESVVVEPLPEKPVRSDIVHALRVLLSSPVLQTSGSRLRMVISDRWLRWLSLPWSDKLMGAASAQDFYRMHFGSLLGVPAQELLYFSDDAPYLAPRAVVGVDQSWLDEIRVLVKQAGLSLSSVKPLSALVAQGDSTRSDRAVCFAERGALTLAVVRGNRVQSVLTQPLKAEVAVEAERMWRRIKLREPAFDSIESFRILDFTQPAVDAEVSLLRQAAVPAPVTCLDFIPRVASASGWRFGLAVAALALFVMSGWYATVLYQKLISAEASRIVVVSSPIKVTPEAARANTARIHSVNQAIRALNMPVEGLLQAVETPYGSGVALLGVDFREGAGDTSGIVKIAAEAKGGAEMAAYVDYLTANGPFKAVYLTRHEMADDQPGHPYRFTVEATWQQ